MGREPVTVVVRHKSCMSLDGRGAPPNVSSGALSLSPGGATPRGTFDSPLSARESSADITPSSSWSVATGLSVSHPPLGSHGNPPRPLAAVAPQVETACQGPGCTEPCASGRLRSSHREFNDCERIAVIGMFCIVAACVLYTLAHFVRWVIL